MKLYTSHFGVTKSLLKAGIKPIGICLYPPQWYLMSGQKNFDMLAPTREIFKLDEAMYTIRFNELLERLDPDNIFNAIGDISNGRDAALLCFEKPGEFCHRRLVAKWLENGLGFEVNEWRSTAKDEDRRPPEAPQLSLF
mgnify:FL=1